MAGGPRLLKSVLHGVPLKLTISYFDSRVHMAGLDGKQHRSTPTWQYCGLAPCAAYVPQLPLATAKPPFCQLAPASLEPLGRQLCKWLIRLLARSHLTWKSSAKPVRSWSGTHVLKLSKISNVNPNHNMGLRPHPCLTRCPRCTSVWACAAE